MAVEREDYELAKQIKMDADRLRATGEAAAGAPAQSTARSGPHPNEIFSRVLHPSVSHVSPGAASNLDPPEEHSVGGFVCHLFMPCARLQSAIWFVPWP